MNFPTYIEIGFEGQVNARKWQFDISEQLAKWPNTYPSISVRRPNQSDRYNAVVTVQNNILTWVFSESDAEKSGHGDAVVRFTSADGTVIGKSHEIVTYVVQSPDIVEGTTPPDKQKPWYDAVLAAAANVHLSAQAAQLYAGKAQEFAQDAQDSASSAESFSTQAQAYAQNAQNSALSASQASTGATQAQNRSKEYMDISSSKATEAILASQSSSSSAGSAQTYASNAQQYSETAKGYADQANSAIQTVTNLKNQVVSSVQQASQLVQEVHDTADAVQVLKNQTQQSESKARYYASQAEASENRATQSASSAQQATQRMQQLEQRVQALSTSASVYAGNAGNSATDAASSADTASKKATSAMASSKKSQDSATSAQLSATSASASASEALARLNELKEGIEKGQFKGDKGDKGDDGFSPIVNVVQKTDGHQVDITDSTSTKSFLVKDGTTGSIGLITDPEDESEGLVLDSTVAQIDTSLSLQGYAAESKTTGDRLSEKVDKSALLDAGIKNVSWQTVLSQVTLATTQDIYKDQRPSGTNTRYWAETPWNGSLPYHEQTFKVVFDGVEYNNLCISHSCINDRGVVAAGTGSKTYATLGNQYLYDSRYYDDGMPFCIIYIRYGTDIIAQTSPYFYSGTTGNIILFTRSAGQHTLSAQKAQMDVNALPVSLERNYGCSDNLYNNIAGSDYMGYSVGKGNIVGLNAYAIGIDNISSDYGAVSIGQECISTGLSVAQGYRTKAQRTGSHAQGITTTSSGYCSHSQGTYTLAFGQCTHAQGQSSYAFNSTDHAQGWDSVASGQMSHAQGFSYAYGVCSHSQGRQTISAKQCQSTSGAFNLIDNKNIGDARVCTQYAIADGVKSTYSIDQRLASVNSMLSPWVYVEAKSDSTYTSTISGHSYIFNKIPPKDAVIVLRYMGYGGLQKGEYIKIVGNGSSDTSRSNAHTLDWQGNAWYSGDVYVGSTSGTNRDDGSVKLAKITDIPATATVAQTKSFLGIATGGEE